MLEIAPEDLGWVLSDARQTLADFPHVSELRDMLKALGAHL